MSDVSTPQTIYYLGLQSGVLGVMSDKERFALLVATLCHDLEHPVEFLRTASRHSISA